MKSRFSPLEKALQVTTPVSLATPTSSTPDRPRTGPGQLMAFMRNEAQNNDLVSSLNGEILELKGKLTHFNDALPARLISADLIHPSHLANRHESSFQTDSFQSFKEEIANSMGNTQPIKVRPHPTEDGHFEIVFGHRRHRACSDLGLPVLAVIEALDDQAMFTQMDRENRERQDLSPYEQGFMYVNALKIGLFSTQIKMASAIGVSETVVSRSISLFKLPQQVIDAFPSPIEIKAKWVQPMLNIFADNKAHVLSVAKKFLALKSAGNHFSAQDVFYELTSPLTDPKESTPFFKNESVEAFARVTSKKAVFVLNGISEDKFNDIQDSISKILAK